MSFLDVLTKSGDISNAIMGPKFRSLRDANEPSTVNEEGSHWSSTIGMPPETNMASHKGARPRESMKSVT